ncbi:MAG: flavin reductase family protein [Alphaproteobacteria bacterium]|nr:flavin reductase family protein [Alphaproteobacteria bacterium]
MFYRADRPHGLRHNPFNAIVVPRPIGWISTVDAEGRANLAPYSFFNGVAYTPPQVMFSSTSAHVHGGGLKDTVANARETGEFVVNICTWTLREAMNATSAPAPHDVDEFALAGLTAEPSELVRAPRVKESPIHLECRLVTVVDLPTSNPEQPNTAVFGEVVGIHIDDAVIVDGLVDYHKVQPIGRLGYMDYVLVDNVFAMQRPGWP